MENKRRIESIDPVAFPIACTTRNDFVAVSRFLTAKNGLLKTKRLSWVAASIELTTMFCWQTTFCREWKLGLTVMVCREYF
jgi:hypothetical protein